MAQIQDLVRKLETESQGLHTKLNNSENEIEKLQNLLKESETKSKSLEEQNMELNEVKCFYRSIFHFCKWTNVFKDIELYIFQRQNHKTKKFNTLCFTRRHEDTFR